MQKLQSYGPPLTLSASECLPHEVHAARRKGHLEALDHRLVSKTCNTGDQGNIQKLPTTELSLYPSLPIKSQSLASLKGKMMGTSRCSLKYLCKKLRLTTTIICYLQGRSETSETKHHFVERALQLFSYLLRPNNKLPILYPSAAAHFQWLWVPRWRG